ncbi:MULTISPECIES: DNA cytosine methyltransferase [Phytobacter]|uniref:DNA (cytosine-5-)-methyltransferase n=1 Tax=Phytobacter diazotrophicus TaxID=395631 RepID=A0ABM7VX70_9ENTR|nr:MULTISPECIES: DNA cytosine methyltransferase [Phytobacter]BBE78472.1 DNA methyltransferase [Phytobacter sp. MRY16-398]BDD51845.1 DNA methyltransferase [Phytobacter diazotrophicus]BEG82774.1 DNA cytosine methyltransferase [Phytobacter diazotrophicus]BEG88672.1 DNA cytosine methyltransferase [Phytobacter diazotrophicus]BEG94436.1 DNA cytosine methyltransferase [Phytobacter diazotrophicus]
MREIIVDNFAGGGGASTGIEMAIGRSVDIAINHDENAVAMHTTNHPGTLHYCESVFDVNPPVVTACMPVGLAWFSPDCRHFSKAKGGTPVEKAIRGLAWIVVRWALTVRPRVMMLENVEEFRTWGPLLAAEMRPDPDRVGETFNAFVSMLSDGISIDHPALAECCEFLNIDPNSKQAQRLVAGLGYAVEHRELRACDYGAPTIRKRFFMVMRCDGTAICWPEQTHRDPKTAAVKSGELKPWRTAAECIDWSIPCPSIFDRKKALATNTMRRIARGIERFVVNSATPFIVKCNHTSTKTNYDCFRGQSLDEPTQTITKKHGFAIATPVVAPIFAGTGGSSFQMKPRPVDKPFFTLLTQNRTNIIAPRLAPIISRQFGNSIGHRVDEPSATVTAGGGGKSQLVMPTLIQTGYGERPGQLPRVPGLDKPLGTVVAGGAKHALVAANLVKHFGGNYSGSGLALDEPVHTVTTTDHHALVTSSIVKMRGTNIGQPTDTPLQTVTAGGLHFGEVRTMLAENEYDEHRAGQVAAFLHEYGISEFVTIESVVYRIVDIGMRMLQPRELYRAQGFPEWYIIDRDYQGVKYAKDKQVARCGNAVPPPFAEALVRANLSEFCSAKVIAA